MIKDMGNVELFELCETILPKTQCKERLLYWNQGIVYCTCGHLLRENEASRGILQWTLDLLSIPNHVIKKGRPHGHRYGKIKEQREHFVAHNLRKRCIKRGFEGIHDRFLKDPEFRESQLEASFSAASLLDGFCTLCALLTRSVIVHDATPCSREDSPYECGRPCDALSCLFFTAQRL